MSKLQVVNEIHKPARKNFSRRRVIVKGLNDTFQADLIELTKFAKQNKTYKYVLTVIDIFSKYAWVRPLKSKTGTEVTNAMKSIFESDLRIPKKMHTDEGKEFYNKYFQNLMNKNHIHHYSTFSTLKAQIVERFNRTLLSKIWKMFSLNGTHIWINKIQSIADEYNNTKHRTIKMKPVQVNNNNEQYLLNTVYKEYVFINKMSRYKINDYVRISKYKGVFEKSYTPNWSTEIFKIYKIQLTNPVTYLLEDMDHNKIRGAFYEAEVQKVKYPDLYLVESIIRYNKNKVFVKWLGFDDSFNSWINKNDLV